MTRAMRRAALATALGAAVLAPTASAIPFGANLALPANAPFDCTVLPVPNVFGTGYVALPSPAPTCTWTAVGTIAQPAAGSFLVPVAGTVTQVRVRVGPVTGPLQVVVLRSFRDANSTASPVCCTEVGRTPPFTPAPNAVTTLQTALAVRRDVLPDPVNDTFTFDALALSVLAPNVPIPAFDSGIHDPANFAAPQAVVFHPAVGPGQERFTHAGVGGFQVLLDADVTPSVSGAGPAPAGGGTAPAAIRLVQAAASVRRGVAPVLVRCELTSGRCGGVLLLQSRPAAAGARAAARRGGRGRLVTYGRRRFDVAAGRRARVRVPLTRAVRRRVARRGSVTAWANATVGGRALAGVKLTLKRPRG